ncbi:hypothetical protein L2E82_26100 [Cichorium intybus]|uniref:Uncharacterized protein n=1 Tax=Cichorium intybus TaxID=13427 RepID=A0ACB9E6E4_CICIN|nr:hypothetical protein L2E82_26100 [Cichorium intybus]
MGVIVCWAGSEGVGVWGINGGAGGLVVGDDGVGSDVSIGVEPNGNIERMGLLGSLLSLEGTKPSVGSTIFVLCRAPIGSDRLEWGAHDLCQAWASRGSLARAISPLAGRVFLARTFQLLASLESTWVF